jgi:hypothetical protein
LLGKIVKITYYDHAIFLNCTSLEDIERAKRQCVGILVYEDKEEIKLVFDYPLNLGSGVRGMALSKADIISIEIIKDEL